jgi:hypothetical protein
METPFQTILKLSVIKKIKSFWELIQELSLSNKCNKSINGLSMRLTTKTSITCLKLVKEIMFMTQKHSWISCHQSSRQLPLTSSFKTIVDSIIKKLILKDVHLCTLMLKLGKSSIKLWMLHNKHSSIQETSMIQKILIWMLMNSSSTRARFTLTFNISISITGTRDPICQTN